MPFLTILAGPNGSGKSTLTGKLKFEGRENLLDPDAIAKRMSPANLLLAALPAGREVIQRTRGYLDGGQSFAIETTLSGGGVIETMRAARDRGFVVGLVYICVGNPGSAGPFDEGNRNKPTCPDLINAKRSRLTRALQSLRWPSPKSNPSS